MASTAVLEKTFKELSLFYLALAAIFLAVLNRFDKLSKGLIRSTLICEIIVG